VDSPFGGRTAIKPSYHHIIQNSEMPISNFFPSNLSFYLHTTTSELDKLKFELTRLGYSRILEKLDNNIDIVS